MNDQDREPTGKAPGPGRTPGQIISLFLLVAGLLGLLYVVIVVSRALG